VASLWDALTQYLRDAAPGGALNPEVTPQGLLDTAAMATAPVPVAGDVVGLLADANRMRDPAERTPLNFGLMALGALPFVPSALAHAGLVKGSRGARAWANQDGAIKVFHGSPHKFDKFDLSKIGTGEGAQAYGHGAYLAESPRVAKEYADSLSPLEILHNGRAVGVFDKDAAANAAHQIRATGGDVNKAIKRAGNIYNGKWRDDVIAEIKRLGPGDVSERIGGNLYEANLRWPDAAREAADPMGPQHFLDWDKPLSNDSPQHIKDAFNKLHQDYPDLKEKLFQAYREGRAGDHYYSLLNDYAKTGDLAKNQEFAAKALRDAGIPGIRYLDAGSRGAGGTSNYVVFDDALIDILTRNGVPVKK
jgi:hypothetical protein